MRKQLQILLLKYKIFKLKSWKDLYVEKDFNPIKLIIPMVMMCIVPTMIKAVYSPTGPFANGGDSSQAVLQVDAGMANGFSYICYGVAVMMLVLLVMKMINAFRYNYKPSDADIEKGLMENEMSLKLLLIKKEKEDLYAHVDGMKKDIGELKEKKKVLL